MEKRRALIIALIVSLAISALGCTTTKISDIRTGILEDDMDKLLAVCDKIDQLEKGQVGRKEIEALGINFGAPNIRTIQGSSALIRLFGGAAIAGTPREIVKSDEAVKSLKDYRLYIIPYRKITIVSDRIYFSEKVIKVKGYDMTLYMVFEKDVLYYSDYRYVYVDIRNSEYAFAQAIFTLLQAPRELMGALNEFLQQNPWLYPDYYPGIYISP